MFTVFCNHSEFLEDHIEKSPKITTLIFRSIKKKKLEKSSVYIYLHSILLKRKN